jgi:hypothetical protein
MFALDQRVVLDADVPIDIVYMAVDHIGIGAATGCSVSSHVRVDDVRVVVGLDSSFAMDEATIHEMITAHVTQLRNIPCMKESLIAVSVETNMSFLVADIIQQMLKNAAFEPVHIVTPARHLRAGVWTTASGQALNATAARRAFKDNKLRIADVITGSNLQSDLATLEAKLNSDKPEVFALQMGIHLESLISQPDDHKNVQLTAE